MGSPTYASCRPRPLRATRYLPLATRCLLLTAHYSTPRPPLATCYLLLATYYSLLTPISAGVQEGDIVNVDVSPILNGVHSDLNETFCVGNVNTQKKNLIKATPPAGLGLGPPL
jgi:hypothetical protein